ncbi:diphosphomevalonate decarboxylase [Saccharicrinis carchari]|uniref:diphosphomevalonate decarboxylase n=1 Tax=Saccharicrinis carchari TaxID=1168039 RepID=A0A521AH64_SACCC|nr:diphosphomevalonate decarboxylase [Saccharicrinis carchari]SMO34165.1 diphosphomevalonate decarboxylase [Saccharicrinis carchari]
MRVNNRSYLSKSGLVGYSSPSNIAIIKYWGKTGVQIPLNPSLSFSLKHSVTETSVSYVLNPGQKDLCFNFYFEEGKSKKFEQKMEVFFNRVIDKFLWLHHYKLKIESKNTFPHSSGIASSASSYAAMALCLAKIHQQITGIKLSMEEISNIARLGSGSACRSVFGAWNTWGKFDMENSSNLNALNISQYVHPSFADIKDTILIVSKDKKEVSSTTGHQLMESHPYKTGRIQQANEHMLKLMEVLKNGDWNSFIEVAETEALSLHGLMMSSSPGYTLLLPNSLQIVQRIRKFREQNKIPVCFTIDAGPNIHVLYSASNKKQVREFIQKELLPYCENKSFINDELGSGPTEII